MSRFARITASAVILLLCSLAAQKACADSFKLDWSGHYGSGNAIVGADHVGGDTFVVTSLAGTQNGRALTLDSFVNPHSDLFFPGNSGHVNLRGLVFNDGKSDFNIFLDSLRGTELYRECMFQSACGNGQDGFKLHIVQVPSRPTPSPEPVSIVLLGSGLCALAGLSLRKRIA